MRAAVPLPKHTLGQVLEVGAPEVGPFHIFVEALEVTGLDKTLTRGGSFTLFVPNDEAFARLAQFTSEDWFARRTRPKLRAILDYHVLPERLLVNEIIKSSTVRTAQGGGLTIRYTKNRMYVNNALVLRTNLAWANGVIHVLDTVVIPR